MAWEDEAATKRLTFAVELQEGRRPDQLDVDALGSSVTSRLAEHSGDFANACRVAAAGAHPTLRIFAAGTGPFSRDTGGLKHCYVSQLDWTAARRLGVVT